MVGMSCHTVLWTFNLGCQGTEEEEIAFAFSFLKLGEGLEKLEAGVHCEGKVDGQNRSDSTEGL